MAEAQFGTGRGIKIHIRLGLVAEEMIEEKRKEKEANNAGQDWIRIAGVTDRYLRWPIIKGLTNTILF